MSFRPEIGSLTGYTGEDAECRARQYESASFMEVHRAWLDYLPPSEGASALDVGAGSGRDAAALSGLGFGVVAVEPSADMLTQAQRWHPSTEIEWVKDGLPQLVSVVDSGRMFDLILVSAVWMHLSEADRLGAIRTLVRLMKPNGVLVITLRHPSDPSRQMFEVEPDELILSAEQLGLDLLFQRRMADPVGKWDRSEVTWSLCVFRK